MELEDLSVDFCRRGPVVDEGHLLDLPAHELGKSVPIYPGFIHGGGQ